MLVNEASRELPRLYCQPLCKHTPDRPTLGRGHVGYWRAHMLVVRVWHRDLVGECHHRGFLRHWPDVATEFWELPIWHDLMEAHQYMRPAMKERIRQQVTRMKRRPTWTNRDRPAWLADINPRRNTA